MKGLKWPNRASDDEWVSGGKDMGWCFNHSALRVGESSNRCIWMASLSPLTVSYTLQRLHLSNVKPAQRDPSSDSDSAHFWWKHPHALASWIDLWWRKTLANKHLPICKCYSFWWVYLRSSCRHTSSFLQFDVHNFHEKGKEIPLLSAWRIQWTYGYQRVNFCQFILHARTW